VVCYGCGCNVHCSNVEFESSTLVVLCGAHATITHSHFSQRPDAAEGVSVMADAADTEVQLEHCKVSGGAQGAVCRNGACMRVQSTKVTETAVTGVEVRGKGSELYMNDCTLDKASCCKIAAKFDLEVFGVEVCDGADANIEHLTVMHGVVGVRVHNRGTVNIEKSKLSNTERTCMSVAKGSSATVKNCSFSESAELHVLEVLHDGS
jgi:nitrous oxidase accessory protein NosD